MLIEWAFTFLVFYLLYKLIFDFIIPVSKATSQVRTKVNEMNRQQQSQFNAKQPPPNAPKQNARPPKDDYIDFEEVK